MRLPHGVPGSGSGVCRPQAHAEDCALWSCRETHRAQRPARKRLRGYDSLIFSSENQAAS